MRPGQVISHYRLIEPIGRDRDTMIYRARDLKLERDVAIKLLAPEDTALPDARERFRREAHIASLVSHPHICAVHDSGEEGGQAFLVCELLEGRALDELVAGGPLPTERVLDLAIQLLDALGAVHRRGIVHGNVKPSNVFVTTEGHVKLLEVGLMSAWWEAAAHSVPTGGSSPTLSIDRRMPLGGGIEGFHAFRSPEQLTGDRVDDRSDLFSAGAIVYEMATGARAFAGGTPAQIAGAIVSGRYEPPSRRNANLPPALDAVIERALALAPDKRYQSAADMAADLRRVRRRLESGTIAPVRLRRKPVTYVVAAAAAAVILLLVGGARWLWTRAQVPATRHALLIGSVANGTNDPDFDGTLREALSVHLGQSPFLDIVSDERLRQILQMMGRPADAPLTHAVAREACQRLGLGAMIEGSVSAVGGQTGVALVATDCATGEPIAREQTEVGRKEEVLRAVGQIASSMRRSLGESVASLEGHNVPIEEATTPSLEALKAYTAGVQRRAAGAEIESIAFFEKAIALDSHFALAYTTLSSIYGGLGETGRGEQYARLAYEHRGAVSERERLFITYQFHDRVTGDQLKAREALEVWKQSYRRDYRPPNALAVLLMRLGDYDRAILEAQDAMQRNPAHPFPYSNLAQAYRGAGRYKDARETAEKAVAMGNETVPTRRLLYQLAEIDHDRAAADRQLEWARNRPRGFDLIGAQAQVAAFGGRLREARILYQQTIAAAGRTGFPQIGSGYASQAAMTEALYANRQSAVEETRQIPADNTYEPQLRGAAALALAGEPAEAEAWVRRIRDLRPDDTLLQSAYLPVADAAIALARHRPDQAVEVLRRAAPYERGVVAALLPPYLRGQARLMTNQPDEAVREFRTVVNNRGVDPFSAVIPLSQLGVARALQRSGDKGGSRQAYQALLEVWRNADADLLIVQQARHELASLDAPDR